MRYIRWTKRKRGGTQLESVSNGLLDQLPSPFREEMTALYQEMEARETVEAKIYKALDNLEAVIQHNESDISTWADHEYELQRTYGNDKVQFSEYLKTLRQEVLEETEEKITKCSQ